MALHRFGRSNALALLLVTAAALVPVSLSSTQAEAAVNVSPGSCGTVLLAGSSWLGGNGVDVKSNGPDEGTSSDCSSSLSYVNGVQAGEEWQCPELINRLYLTRGWITATWHGDAGQQLYDDTPSNLTKQPNGSVSYLGPGDVVIINVYHNNTPDGGHALIVNDSSDVSSGTVDLVSQNGGDPTNATPQVSGTISGGSVTVGGGGDGWSYSTIGVVHAPTSFTPPANGTFVQLQGTTEIYEMAGGAPLYVSSWAAVGGPQPYQTLTQAQWNTLNAVPANGTFIRTASNLAIYEVAGGAPLYVSSCAAIEGGCTDTVDVDPWDLANITNPDAHLNAVPTNGTFVRNATSLAIYEVAGGAPLYVSSCAAIPGGCTDPVNIDPWDLANISNPTAHLNAVPANGTLIRTASNLAIYEVAGGAPLFLSSCTAIPGGCTVTVNVDPWDLANITNPAAHLNPVPASRTFIRSGAAGAYYRVAGGYPFRISNCGAIGGCDNPVTVDPWDLNHLKNPSAHLRTRPRNGTVVRCYPSRTYWSFTAGKRHRAKASSRAVAVDNSSVRHFPI
jgi:hypothetical protein